MMLKHEEKGKKALSFYVRMEARDRGVTTTSSDHILGIIAEDGVEYLDYHVRGVPILPIGDNIFEVLDNPFMLSGEIDELSILTQRVWEEDNSMALKLLGLTEEDLSYEEEQIIEGERKTVEVIHIENTRKLDGMLDEILEQRYLYWKKEYYPHY